MTRMKKVIFVGAAVLIAGAISVTAFAASAYKTPAEAAAGVTGKTVDQVIEERQDTGKTYGSIAADAGKLEEFKDEMIAIKKDILDQKVAAGILTQEKADEILKAIEENAATCDGTGSAKIGQSYGAGFGMGSGSCANGTCSGKGRNANAHGGRGMGNRLGHGIGVCVNQ